MIGVLAQVSTFGGALLYGLGWLFCLRFFGALGTTPEQVGVTFSFIVVRAALLLIGLLLVITVAINLFGQQRSVGAILLQDKPIRVRQSIFLAAYFALLLVLGTGEAIAILWMRPWQFTSNPFAARSVAFLVAGLALTFLVIIPPRITRFVGWSAHSDEVRIRRPELASIVALLLLTLVCASAIGLAEGAANRVEAGNELAVLGLRVERVSVSAATRDIILPETLTASPCLFFLGVSEGTFVLFDSRDQSLHYINSQLGVIRKPSRPQPCNKDQVL